MVCGKGLEKIFLKFLGRGWGRFEIGSGNVFLEFWGEGEREREREEEICTKSIGK